MGKRWENIEASSLVKRVQFKGGDRSRKTGSVLSHSPTSKMGGQQGNYWAKNPIRALLGVGSRKNLLVYWGVPGKGES